MNSKFFVHMCMIGVWLLIFSFWIRSQNLWWIWSMFTQWAELFRSGLDLEKNIDEVIFELETWEVDLKKTNIIWAYQESCPQANYLWDLHKKISYCGNDIVQMSESDFKIISYLEKISNQMVLPWTLVTTNFLTTDTWTKLLAIWSPDKGSFSDHITIQAKNDWIKLLHKKIIEWWVSILFSKTIKLETSDLWVSVWIWVTNDNSLYFMIWDEKYSTNSSIVHPLQIWVSTSKPWDWLGQITFTSP